METMLQKLQIQGVHRNLISVTVILLLIFSLVLVVFVMNKQTATRSQAAAVSQETEEGVLQGAAAVREDTNASGGLYIEFGQ